MVDEKKYGHIEIKNVSKRYINLAGEENDAVDNVSLDIKPGEFVSFMGPSGCGKTTLLRIIAGLLIPDEGQLYLDGEEIKGPGYERGLVFQNPELFEWLNVEQNVAFGLKARKVYKEQKENVQKYIDMVGLNGFEKALPHHLSGGMQQRTAFARALINHPKVLLLDEPFGALDAFTRVSLQDRLIELWKSIGYTAIMVTHDVEEAVVLSQKVVVMTGRPAKVSKIFEINQDYPRNRNSIEMVELKQKILEEMHI